MLVSFLNYFKVINSLSYFKILFYNLSVCKTQTLGIFFVAKDIIKKMSEVNSSNEPVQNDSD